MSQFLEAISISKAYPGESLGAVEDLSFHMEQGQIQSFIGQSGSGKSTLLRLIGGLLKPDSGHILFKGQALENPEEQLIAGHPAIKMVFQDFDLMPNMTVAENLRYPLLNFNREYIRQRVAELLVLCRIEELAAKLPRELSGGQQQRVALARALADEPELLLMDEPFSQLDPINKAGLLQEILYILKTERVGLILVTHDVRDALMISDRVGFLQKGALLQNDTPQVLYKQPVNLDIATFFGHVNTFSFDRAVSLWPWMDSENKQEGGVTVGVRAEDLTLVKAQEASILTVIVEQSFYQGNRFLVRAADIHGGEVVFYHSGLLEAQTKVYLSVLPERVLSFSG